MLVHRVCFRDEAVVRPMRVRLVEGEADRSRLWKRAIATYPPYAEYQERTARRNSGLCCTRFSEVATKARSSRATRPGRLVAVN